MYLSRQKNSITEETGVVAATKPSAAKKAPAVHPFQMLSEDHKSMQAKLPAIQRTSDNKTSLKPGKTNHTPNTRGTAISQFKLENTKKNQNLNDLQSAVESYATALSNAVEQARSMIATKYFVHVPAADGYMQNFVDNFSVFTNKFIDTAAMPRQAGYWIESYVTKIVRPSASGLDILLQSKRGNSRPDVILQYKGTDLAWLDITSTVSEGHIYDKNSEGWNTTPYVTEVTYDGLKVIDLNLVDIPDVKSQDLSKLIERANEAKKKQLEWEQELIEKKGLALAKLLQGCYWYIKKCAVEEVDDLSGRQFDKLYSPNEPGNKFEQWALVWVKKFTGKEITARELASMLMYWSGMLIRYVKRFNNINLPSDFNLPTKANLGLSWVDDSSSSDGEPVIRELFPV
jgi:hypothetical protein